MRPPCLSCVLPCWLRLVLSGCQGRPQNLVVVRAVPHFARCTVNDARTCAKEILRVVPRHRITLLLALSAHSNVPPRAFPMRPNFWAHAAKPASSKYAHFQDVAKIRTAILLLTKCRVDSDFPDLLQLLSDCNAPAKHVQHPDCRAGRNALCGFAGGCCYCLWIGTEPPVGPHH